MPENTVTHTINVPLDRRDDYRSVHMKQADSGRILVVRTMFQEQYLEFPDGTTGEFRAGKPDGTYVTRTDGVNVNGSTTTIEITSNTLAVDGSVFCDVIYSFNGKTLGIANFIIKVMPGAIPKGAIESYDDWQSLSEAATAATAAADRAETAATQSEDILTQIQDIEHYPVRVNPETGNLENWDSTTQSWVDSGVSVGGAGDMQKSIYDPAGGAKQVAFADEVGDMLKSVYDPEGEGKQVAFKDEVLTIAQQQTQADVNLYVTDTGNDTTGDGSSASPFRTIQSAIDALPKRIEHTVTINVGDGVFYNDVVAGGFMGAGRINIFGYTANSSIPSSGTRTQARGSVSVVNCSCKVYISGLYFFSADATGETRDIYISACNYVNITYCYTGRAASSIRAQFIYAGHGSNVFVREFQVAGPLTTCVYCVETSKATASNGSVTGTGVTNYCYANTGGLICRYGTAPAQGTGAGQVTYVDRAANAGQVFS